MDKTILEILTATYSQVPVTSVDGLTLDVKWLNMNNETLAHLAWHGLKQKANDPNGAKGLTNGEKQGNSEKVIAALEANEVRRATRIGDPIESELMKRLVAKVSDAIIKKGGKLKDYKMADLRARAEEAKTKYPEMVETLRASITQELAVKAASLASIEIEI